MPGNATVNIATTGIHSGAGMDLIKEIDPDLAEVSTVVKDTYI
jgi:hypothetical protein